MSGLGAGAAAVGTGFAAPPPFRVIDSSTLKLSSRSLAATRLAVSASLNAPTCTQNGPVPVDGFAVAAVAVAAARLGAGAGLAATAGFAVSAVAGFAVSAFATVSGLGFAVMSAF